MAVVTAGELDNAIAAGEAPGQADGRHRGLRAAIDHPKTLNAGHGLYHVLGQLAFALCRSAEGGSRLQRFLDCFDHGRVAVPQDHRPPRTDVVQITIAIDVGQRGTVALGEQNGVASNGAEGAGRAVDATGNRATGTGKLALAVRPDHGHGLPFLLRGWLSSVCQAESVIAASGLPTINKRPAVHTSVLATLLILAVETAVLRK